MALIERDLLGNETDKVKKAVDILKMFERDDGYYVAYVRIAEGKNEPYRPLD